VSPILYGLLPQQGENSSKHANVCDIGILIAIFYFAISKANPTDELEERLQQMTLPNPSLPIEGPLYSNNILYHYPYVIHYLQKSVCSFQSKSYL